MAVRTPKRIRRRNASSASRASSHNLSPTRLQLLLIGGVLFLAISFTTNTVRVNAFPIQHPLSSSRSNTLRIKNGSHARPQPHKHDCSPQQPSNHRRVTFLSAEPSQGESSSASEGSVSSAGATKSSIAASIDAAGIAAMDPDYQKYKESLHLEAEPHDEEADEAFYKDFANYDYTPFLERDDALALTMGETTVATDPVANNNNKEKEKQQELVETVRPAVADMPVHVRPLPGFNVVLTHCTADFDSLASAVGLAKLWTTKIPRNDDDEDDDYEDDGEYDSSTDNYPTFVVLPRGAHPAVQRFLALHKHLFPIQSLKSLPKDLSKLHKLALVDAQRKERIGPAEVLLQHADRITVVDHHVDMESDIPGITDYVVDGVGSVSTLIVERLMKQQERQLNSQLETSSSPINTLTEAEATLLALGIHADTGSLIFDSTTPRDASALAWVMAQGASQMAIAEHAQQSLSPEQQKVLTQALVNTNSTVAHGVTISTVLLTADGFINGLAAVTQDALELSSSDVFLLGVVYEPKSGGRGGKGKKNRESGNLVKTKLLTAGAKVQPEAATATEGLTEANGSAFPMKSMSPSGDYKSALILASEEKRKEEERLKSSFAQKDLDGDGFIDKTELAKALVASGIIATEDTVRGLMESIDANKDGKVDFEEFRAFSETVKSSLVKPELSQQSNELEEPNSATEANGDSAASSSPPSTLIIIGRAKPGVNLKSVKLGKLLEQYGGGGHPKAASATVRLNHESEATTIMAELVDELIETSLQEQSTVGDFMTSPVLSVKADMNEHQVEDLFTRYDVRALPVVNEGNEVIGLVTYKEVAAAKQRMFNKEQKRLRQEQQQKEKQKNKKKQKPNEDDESSEEEKEKRRKQKQIVEVPVKAWMKQHIKTVESSRTMAEVEAILLENDVGCIPVVQDGTEVLVGMVTRTDLLRQHRYYPSLHYNNKGMSDSIASRKPIIALRKKLKQFDLDE